MKIIVTGGSGFVGSHTIKALKEKGYNVLNYDIKEGYDIRNFEQLSSSIQSGDKILHLAAIAKFDEADNNPLKAWTTNVEGTDLIAKVAKKNEAERIVYGSTGSVYMPIEETPPITESFKVRGNSIYGCTKLFGGLAIKRSGVPYIILRYAHLYGEGKLSSGAIGGFISRMERGLAPLLYGGEQSSDFTYIKDIVQANILALESDKLNETYNIGTGEELTTENVFGQLKEFFKYNGDFDRKPVRAVDASRFVYDISKARNLLGYNPQYNFKSGMNDWYGKVEKSVQSLALHTLYKAKLCTLSGLLKELEEKPLRIAIETSSVCNAKCSFCAYKYSDRPKQIMDLETYKKVLEQVKEFNCRELKFTPITGDALVDPGIIEKIKYAKSLNCFKVIYTFTNLIGLNRERVDEFVNSGLTKVMISTCLQSREDYKRIYGVDQFDRVFKNIITLLESNERNGHPINIGILLRHDKDYNLDSNPYFQKIAKFNPKVSVLNDDYDNWSGMVTLRDLPRGQKFIKEQVKSLPCSQLYNGFIVTPSGDVGACWARDMDLDLKVGNIYKNTLDEIWHSNELKKMREDWINGTLPKPCQACLQYCSVLDHSLVQKHILSHPIKYIKFLPRVVGLKAKYLVRRLWTQ